MTFYEALDKRRSRYDISGGSPISDERIEEILGHAITRVPSAFNSQSSRTALLFTANHQKLWSIVRETLRPMVSADKFEATDKKISSFAAGHGTILFFEDMETVSQMQKDFPFYADNFPVWSNQSAGMLQFALWTALSSEGLGASLQHYNPLIDAETAKEFGIPPGWKLLAQMPFGTPTAEPEPIEHKPVTGRLIIPGGKK